MLNKNTEIGWNNEVIYFFHGDKTEYCEDCKDSLFMGSYCDYSSKLNLALIFSG